MERAEPVARKSLQHPVEFHQRPRQHLVAIQSLAARGLKIGDGLVHPLAHRLGKAHVDADADHGEARAERIALHFDQDASQLGAAP